MERLDAAMGASPAGRPVASARDLIGISLAAGLLFFVSLGARDLWNPNEPIYGRAVVEMAERGDWLVPTVNDKVFAEKPILYFWGALATAELFGSVDELTLRLPAAVAALASAVLTYLLVLPYAGRRRACLAAALFVTLYQVFWAARAIQMDVLVLASTLGVVVPLTRVLDFKARPAPAFALAGVAAGLGFLAKGPVVLVIPAIVILGYAATMGRLGVILSRHLFIAVAVAIAISAPWFVLLWLRGETDFLYEVLFRQNVTRFLDAWDHRQPWWYYFKYLWVDYAPWSWLLPAAALVVPRRDEERRLHLLSWIWLLGVIAFFSMSESKRAPYILVVAPAVAALASGVVERWVFGNDLEPKARAAARLALATLAIVLSAVGIGGIALVGIDLPSELRPAASVVGALMVMTGLVIGWGLVARSRHPGVAPIGLLCGFASLYLVAAVWALPAADPIKSARHFSTEMNRVLEEADGTVASFLFWNWRSGYSYYGNRSIPGLQEPDELKRYWRETPAAHVLVENEDRKRLLAVIPEAHLVQEGTIGNREAFLFAKAPSVVAPRAPLAGGEQPEREPATPHATYPASAPK